MTSERKTPAAKSQIGDYQILQEIASTALSEVYAAKDQSQSKVCIKILKSEDESSEVFQSFCREAKILSSIHHPNILKVMDFGRMGQRPYLCSEFIEGQELEALITKGSLPLDEKLSIMIQAARGVKELHAKGIIHRDLKPQNIMIRSGEDIEVVIADLGLAVIEGEDLSTQYAGTINYSPPEQLGIINSPVDHRSDLYSIGVIFYEMIAGSIPYDLVSSSTTEAWQKSVEDIYGAIGDAPPVIAKIVMKLIERNPSDRYQTAEGLLHDIDFALAKIKNGDPDPKIELDEKSKSVKALGKVFVGRKKELAFLEKSFQDLSQGTYQFVTVGGVAGVGKSSLIREMQNRSALDGSLLCYGKSYEFSNGLPYYCLGEVFEDFLSRIQKMKSDQREKVLSLIKREVGDLGSEFVRVAPSFKSFLDTSKEVSVLSPEREKARFNDLVKRVLQRVASLGNSVVLFLDDLQWADRSTIDLIESFEKDPPDNGVMVVGSYRSEEIYRENPFNVLVSKEDSKDIVLPPFTKIDTLQVIAKSLGKQEEAVSEELVDVIQEQTSGNPLFISELLKMFLSEKVINISDNAILFDSTRSKKIVLPDSVTELVINRVKLFDPESIQIIADAAMIGVDFSYDELCNLSGSEPELVYQVLVDGVEQQIFKKLSSSQYSFFHDRIHESCRELIPAHERPKIHARIVRYLESKEEASERYFELAEHSILANDRDRTIKYGLVAAKASFDRHSLDKAKYYYIVVTEKIGLDINDQNLDAFLGYADVNVALGKYDIAMESLQALIDKKILNNEKEVVVLSKLAECLQRSGDYKKAREILTEALKKLSMPLWTKHLWLSYIIDAFFASLFFYFSKVFGISEKKKQKYVLACDVLRKFWMVQVILDMTPLLHISYRMLRYSYKLPICTEQAVAHQYLSFSLMNRDKIDGKKAFYHAKKSIQIAKKTRDNEVVAGSMVRLAAYHSWMGLFEESKKYADEARDILISMGNLWDVGNAIIFSFFANKALGNTKGALSDAYSLQQLGEKTGSAGMLASGTCKVAEILFLNGEATQSEDALQKGLELANENSLSFDKFQLLKAKGMVALLRGNLEESREIFSQAISILESGKASFFKAYLSAAYLGFCEAVFKDRSIGSEDDLVKKAKKYLDACRVREKYYSEMGWVERNQALMLIKAKKKDEAVEHLHKAIELYSKQGRPLEIALAEFDLASILKDEDREKALGYARSSYEKAKVFGLNWVKKQIRDVIVACGGEVEGRDDNDESKAKRLEEILIEIGTASTSSLNPKDQTMAVLDKVIEVLQADRALLFLQKKDEGLDFYYGRNSTKSELTSASAYSRSFVQRLSKSKEPLLLTSDGSDEFNQAHSVIANNLLSIVGAPIYSDGELKGVLYVDSKIERGLYNRNDSQLLWSIAQQIGIAFKMKEMAEIEVRSAILEKDLELTGAVQNLILPKQASYKDRNFSLSTFYQPAAHSGGDWWWHSKIGENRHLALIGDVTGHGAGAAMVTAFIAGLSNYILEFSDFDCGDYIKKINSSLYNACQESYAMSLIMADLNFENMTVDFWFVGAPGALFFSPEGKGEFISAPSTLLGFENLSMEKVSSKLHKGCKIMLFSDGLTEAPMQSGYPLSDKRFVRMVEKYVKYDCDESVTQLIDGFNRDRLPGDLDDDLSIVMIQIDR